jgi:hypothetical protein
MQFVEQREESTLGLPVNQVAIVYVFQCPHCETISIRPAADTHSDPESCLS